MASLEGRTDVIEIDRCVASADVAHGPELPPEARPLASFHPLILAVCRETRRFPEGDPIELGLGIRGAALGAAEAMLAGCELRRLPPIGFATPLEDSPRRLPIGLAAALVEAKHRLRELACCIEIARRLGYLTAERASELSTLHARATRAVAALGDLAAPEGPAASPGEVRQPVTAECVLARPARPRLW
jgi:hypothetical protein